MDLCLKDIGCKVNAFTLYIFRPSKSKKFYIVPTITKIKQGKYLDLILKMQNQEVGSRHRYLHYFICQEISEN